MWAEYTKSVAKSDPVAVMLATLKRYYPEDELVTMLVAAKESNTIDMLFAQLYAEWITAEKTLDEAFTTFGLHEVTEHDLKHGAFTRWLSYADEYFKAHDDNNKSIVESDVAAEVLSTLQKNLVDKVLVNLLAAAKKTDRVDSIFSKLYAEWVNRYTPLDISGALGLQTASSEEFRDRWISYVDEYFNAQDIAGKSVPEYLPENMVRALTIYYPKDKMLSMLANAKRTDEADRIFSRLYTKWMTEGKTPLDVFMAFGLHEAKTVDAKHASFARWLDFIDTQNKDQGNAGLIMLTAVAGHVSYSDLIQLLGKAKTEAAQIARNMLPRFWSKNGPNEAFKEAALKGDGELLSSAGFLAWIKFMSSHNKANPSQKASVFETMERFFGEKQLTTVLIAASKNSVSTELSKELLPKQLEHWLERKTSAFAGEDYTPETVFTKLQLDKDKNVIMNPLFRLWVNYAGDDRGRVPILPVLLEYYETDVLARMILEAKKIEDGALAEHVKFSLFNYWLDRATSTGKDHRLFAFDALRIGENGLPSDLLSVYKEFSAFSAKTMNLRMDAAGTPSVKAAQMVHQVREKKTEAAKAKEAVPMKSTETWWGCPEWISGLFSET
uniref:Uncharacterized protein n=1 Tax=Peronospora matthiolae TaxID=2874970 RepID=A0AAV1US88_9STRA